MSTFGISTIDMAGVPTLAVVYDSRLLELGALIPGRPARSFRDLLEDWDGWCDAIEDALRDASDAGSAFNDARFLPPILDPGSIYGAGANYRDHAAEMQAELPEKEDRPPYHFQLPPASMIGHGEPVRRPSGCHQLDWEAELAVVIGRQADRVNEGDALDFVAGYVNANDISLRDPAFMLHPMFGMDWQAAKGQRAMQPIGPAVVPTRFVPDPMNLTVSLRVNSVVMQASSTAEMIYSVQEQIAALSARVPLRPGDIILTGTPAGTGASHGRYLNDGDRMVVAVERLGELVNDVQ